MIKLSNVTKEFKTRLRTRIVLKDINFELSINSLVVIVGESGSGKSTLLDILSLNDRNYKGSYFIQNQLVTSINFDKLKKNIVFLNQGQTLFYELNVKDNALLVNNHIIKDIFSKYIKNFGLSMNILKKTKYLSGGEKQRVGIVRSLSKHSNIIILDEPTSNLDQLNKSNFIEEIVKYKHQRLIIIATHDKTLIDIADQVFSIANNTLRIIKDKTTSHTKTILNGKNNSSVFLLVVKDLASNKIKLFKFIASLSNGLIGLMLGFVIVSGFEKYFVSLILNEVPSSQSIVYPTNMINNQAPTTKKVIVFDNSVAIKSELFTVYDERTDYINNLEIYTGLKDNQIILELTNENYHKYLAMNKKTLTLIRDKHNYDLVVTDILIGQNNKLIVSENFVRSLLQELSLWNSFKEYNVLDYKGNIELANIAKEYRLVPLRNFYLLGEKESFLNYYDIKKFENNLVCNKDYKIYCDLTSANPYVELFINQKPYFVKLSNKEVFSLSSSIYKQLKDSKVSIEFLGETIVLDQRFEVFESDKDEVFLPFTLFNDVIISKKEFGLQAEYLLINENLPYINNNYEIVNPYDEYYSSFKEILDKVMLGFLIYSSTSLILGFITISFLTLLELDEKKKHVGTLLMLGWSKNEIRIWVLISSFLKVLFSIAGTIILLFMSVNSLNIVIKEVSDLEIRFQIPEVEILIVLIISSVLIVGNIALFQINSMLKISPKKLISGK